MGQLGELVTASFVPPNSGLLGELVARVFRRLYILEAPPWPNQDTANAPTVVDRNLEVLSRVANPIRRDELHTTLECLENSLEGLCRDRSSDWLVATRSQLLLRQMLWVAKARVQCLTTLLL